MVTGIEIAGLVLGSIPLLVSGLEHYAEGVHTIEKWWRYERELSRIKRLLLAEQTVFIGTIERLLEGLVAPAELDQLLDGGGEVEWADSVLDDRLQTRLGRSYQSFKDCVVDMDRVVNALAKNLEIDPSGRAPAWTDGSSMRKQVKRILFSLSRSHYEELLESLEKNNTLLTTLLSQNLELEPLRKRKTRHYAKYNVIDSSAESMQEFLQKGWQCKKSHRVMLQLDSGLPDIAVLTTNFDPNNNIRFNLVFEDAAMTSAKWPPQWVTANLTSLPTKASMSRQVIPDLPKAQKCKPTEENNKRSRFRDLFHRRSKSDARPPQSVRFQDPQKDSPNSLLKVPSEHRSAESAEALNGSEDEIRDFCSFFESTSATGAKVSAHFRNSSIKVYKGEDADAQKQADGRAMLLQSMASAENIKKSAKLRLASFLDKTATARIMRSERYAIAFTLASSILQLASTNWFTETWNKDSIVVFYDGQGATIDLKHRLFIESSFPKQDSAAINQNSTFPGIRNHILFRFGIVLIELCLGQSLESLRSPQDQLGPDGKANYITDWATASRLVVEVSNEAGNRYGDAVRRCLHCDFDERSCSLTNGPFRQAVYNGVVAPLSDIYQDFIGNNF